jgi:hypothetical protein
LLARIKISTRIVIGSIMAVGIFDGFGEDRSSTKASDLPFCPTVFHILIFPTLKPTRSQVRCLAQIFRLRRLLLKCSGMATCTTPEISPPLIRSPSPSRGATLWTSRRPGLQPLTSPVTLVTNERPLFPHIPGRHLGLSPSLACFLRFLLLLLALLGLFQDPLSLRDRAEQAQFSHRLKRLSSYRGT